MGPRMWAAFGNILRIFSIPTFIGAGLIAFTAVQMVLAQAPTQFVLIPAIMSIVFLVIGALFWLAKGPLVSGSVVARFLVGIYMILWVFSTFGMALLVIGVVYFFTGEPEVYSGIFREREPARRHFVAPPDWQATGRVGPSGAMLYSDADQESTVGIFDSWLPVQVVDRRNGLAHVVAATGERGWIDLRTLNEAA